MTKPAGVIVPCITVFQEDERIDDEATGEHIRWLVEAGVDGVTPCGSSGELIALTLEERKRLISLAMDAVGGRVPVLPSTGCYSTRETVELSQHAERAGAHGVMVVLPYYLLPD